MPTAFPDAPVLERVLDLAAHAPSARNAQPWRWLVDDRGVMLFADWTRRLGDSDHDRRDVVLSCGAVLHHCAVALAAEGWSARIHRFPDHDVLATVELEPAAPSGGTLELIEAMPHRRADRRPFRGDLDSGTIELLMLRAERFGVRLSVVPSTRWARAGDTVTLRYGDGSPDHPGDDAAMLVLATDSDSEAMRLRAGEALSAVTLSATALGLVTCPLTEPLREARDRLMLSCELFDGQAVPQALIRLGPQSSGDPLPPVPRRSVAETTTFDL